jgi:hypothetical protein
MAGNFTFKKKTFLVRLKQNDKIEEKKENQYC